MVCRLGVIAAVAGVVAGPATVTAQEDPLAQPTDSYIRLGGTVVDASAERFKLDYGDGLVTVELDDLDDLPEAAALLNGDEVIVWGWIDESMFERTRIEAKGVYVKTLKTFFFGDAADEDGFEDWGGDSTEISRVSLRGSVTGVSPEIDQFTLATGQTELTVETAGLMYDPYDHAGYQTISKGDRVSVRGTIEREFFEGRVFEATSVVTLEQSGGE